MIEVVILIHKLSNISANAIAKYFRTLGYGRGSGLSTQAGAIRELIKKSRIK